MSESSVNAGNPVLRGELFARILQEFAQEYTVDSAALGALALAKGASGTISPNGYGYGPFWLDLRTPQLSKLGVGVAYSEALNAWAWTPNGIHYAVDQLTKRGLYAVVDLATFLAFTSDAYGVTPGSAEADKLATLYVRLSRDNEQAYTIVGTAANGANATNAQPSVGVDSTTATDKNVNAWAFFVKFFSRDCPTYGNSALNYVVQIGQVLK